MVVGPSALSYTCSTVFRDGGSSAGKVLHFSLCSFNHSPKAYSRFLPNCLLQTSDIFKSAKYELVWFDFFSECVMICLDTVCVFLSKMAPEVFYLLLKHCTQMCHQKKNRR